MLRCRCEFIEDCEFTYLSTQILHLLGVEGPKTKDPGRAQLVVGLGRDPWAGREASWLHGRTVLS